MSYTTRLILPAEQEMFAAARYYELQAPGLGHDFLDKVAIALQDLACSPERWPVVQADIRRRLTQWRFFMKTIDEQYTPKALRDVWTWKDSVYRDTTGKDFSEVTLYFADGMNEAAQILGASIVSNSDGSYSFKRG